MSILELMEKTDCEEILLCHDSISGLKAVIVIHDTTLGPAMGGLRIDQYPSDTEAVSDALRLSHTMTLKASAAGLNLGGGSAIILCDPKREKSEAVLRAFGRHVQSLCGRIIIGEDAGTTVEDMDIIAQETRYVVGLNKRKGGSGDPAIKGAFGVFRGIQACMEAVHGTCFLRNRTVAIQGVGSVGLELARLLSRDGARLIVSDIDESRIQRAQKALTVEVVEPEKIFGVDCDVFSPCARSGILTEKTLASLKAGIVAGSANNQLESDRVGEMMHAKGIVYAPDLVINAGGMINAAEELHGYDETTANLKVSKLFSSIQTILRISREKNIPTSMAAKQWANERLRLIRDVRRNFLPGKQ